MPHAARLSVTGSFDDSAALHGELSTEPEFRGCVRRLPAEVPDGTLGGGLPDLLVTLGSSGLATALASVIVVWLRQRSGTVSIRVTRPDGGALVLTAKRVRALDRDAIKAQVDQLAALLRTEDEC
jgi:Effector Associated Constant Component 1